MSTALAAPDNTTLPAAVSALLVALPAMTTGTLVELMMLQILQQQQQNLTKAQAPPIPATVAPLSDALTSPTLCFAIFLLFLLSTSVLGTTLMKRTRPILKS